MGVINEAFHEILILAKDGMDIREEGLSTTEYAGSLVAAEKVFGEIKKALKEGSKSLSSEKEAIGELLNDMRRNPNMSLEEFSDPEIPKSCEIQDDGRQSVLDQSFGPETEE